jgi:Glycosyltransferase 61
MKSRQEIELMSEQSIGRTVRPLLKLGRRWPQRIVQRLGFPWIRRWRSWRGPGPEEGGVPRGIFREVREIRRGRVEGAVVADGQALPDLPADSEIIACGLGQAAFGNWPVLWSRRESVRLLGRSLVPVDPVGRACFEAMFGPQASGDPVWWAGGAQPARELAGSWTSLVSRWTIGSNYYHWLTDGLTRLLHLPAFPQDTGILVPAGLPAFARDSLRLLGLWDRVREVEGDHLVVETHWFAGPPAVSGCLNPLGIRWLRRALGPEPGEGSGHRKIFISRQGTTRDMTNLPAVERVLRAEGWEVIDPGKLSFREQIETFRKARVVAGVHGAGMSNLLWAPAGTRVIELMPDTFRNGCYEAISRVIGHRHEVLLCRADKRGCFHLDATVMGKVLMLGDAPSDR